MLSMHIFTCICIECRFDNRNVSLTAEREEMISCVFVSREEERVAVAFSRPVNVRSFSLPDNCQKACVYYRISMRFSPAGVRVRPLNQSTFTSHFLTLKAALALLFAGSPLLIMLLRDIPNRFGVCWFVAVQFAGC